MRAFFGKKEIIPKVSFVGIVWTARIMLQSTVTLGRSICVILVLHTFITTTTITTFAIIITTTSSRQLDFNNKVSNQSVKVEISNSQQHRQHSQWETEAFQYSTNEIVASDFDLFWFDCNYNSIEPNYFQVNNTFLLAFGGVLLYQCTSIVDVRNCTSIGNIDHYNAHLAGTKLISSLNCQDVSITIHQPDSLNLFPGKTCTNNKQQAVGLSIIGWIFYFRGKELCQGGCSTCPIYFRLRQVRGMAQHNQC